jgi:hypothetical protein
MVQASIDGFKFLDLPYSDRQLIVVTDDEVVKASRDAERQVAERGKGVDWAKIGELAVRTLMGGPGLLLAEITKEAFKAWSKARESGIQILQLGKTESKTINFPPGHPREGLLYIGHPAEPNVYYTTAEFHRITFEHKFCEAIILLMSLGATKISVEHVSGWSKDFSSRLSVPLSEAGDSVGVDAGYDSQSKSQLLYEATLTGTKEPNLPENLAWYPHEPTWQSIATGRINFGLKDFSLSVSYEDDYGVNAGLKVAVQKAGLELGGKFEDHQSTVWRIAGQFRSDE